MPTETKYMLAWALAALLLIALILGLWLWDAPRAQSTAFHTSSAATNGEVAR